MKLYLRLLVLAVVALASVTATAQQAPTIATDKWGFYKVVDTPTSVGFIKASTEFDDDDGSWVVNIYRGREVAQFLKCDVTSGDLHYLDANFDGSIDIMVGPAESRNYSTILLWNDSKGEFVPIEQEPLNGFFMVNPKQKLWLSAASSSYCSMYYEVMKWKGDRLVTVESLIEISDPTQHGEYGVQREYTIIKGGDFENIAANRTFHTNSSAKLPAAWQQRLKAYEAARQ